MPDTDDARINTAGKKRKHLDGLDPKILLWARRQRTVTDPPSPTPGATMEVTMTGTREEGRSFPTHQFFTPINALSGQKSHSDDLKVAGRSLQGKRMRRVPDPTLPAAVRTEDAKSTVCSDVAVLGNWSPHPVRPSSSDGADFEESPTEVEGSNAKVPDDTKRGEFVGRS